jgi:predicted transport protein
VALYRQGKNRRFPSDAEFRESLETRNLYDMRHCHYLLSRLENDSKEEVGTDAYTIEHIMPQNTELDPAWRAMLGPDWAATQEHWLHRLGNLTLTAYNTEYSDRSFQEKKAMPKGFAESPLRLNKFVKEQHQWTPAEMEARGQALAEKALPIWPALHADLDAVRKAELADRKTAAARYDQASVGLDPTAASLFALLRPQVMALGEDVVELFGDKSVTYRVYEYFLQVLPRRGRLFLLLNLDFDAIDDPSGRATDMSTYAFVLNSTEEGGVGCEVRVAGDIPAAMDLIRQAYQDVAD